MAAQALINGRPYKRLLVFCTLISLLMFIRICTQYCALLLNIPSCSVDNEHEWPLSKQGRLELGGDLEQRLMRLAGEDMERAMIEEQVAALLDEGWMPSIADRFWDLVLGRDEEERLEAARVKLARQGHRVLPVALTSVWEARRWKEVTDALRRWAAGRFVFEPDILKSLLRSVKAPIDKFHVERRLPRSDRPGAAAAETAPNYGDGGLITEHRQMTTTIGDIQATIHDAQDMEHIGKPYQSCAVVGNSGILLNSRSKNYSSLIDSHHAVIRINHAPTAGFEQFVGRKTTLAFINSHVLHTCAGAGAGVVQSRRCRTCQPYGEEVPTLVYICQPAHFLDMVRCEKSAMKAPLLVTDARLDALCARIAKFYSLKGFVERKGRLEMREWSGLHGGKFFHYSTGLQAVVVALGMCGRVSLFGFGKLPNATHHYHSTQQDHELSIHDYAAEYRFYQDLQSSSTSSRANMAFISRSGLLALLPPTEIFA